MANDQDIHDADTAVLPSPRPTLAERNGLWFGVSGDRSVEFKSWDTEQELLLSRALFEGRGKLEGGRIGRKITITLSHMCTKLAGATFWEDTGDGYREVMGEIERENHIRRMWETDVLTAYLLLRIDALGEDTVSLQIPSPFDPLGERQCPWRGDISKAEFYGVDEIEHASWVYELKRPFKIRGKHVTKLNMGPLRWVTADSLAFQTNAFEAKMRGVLGSIHSIPEVSPSPATSYTLEDLKRMSKLDIEAIAAEIESDKHRHGLDLEIECYDEKAKRTFTHAMPWMHPDFFSVSSQSPQ